MKHKPKTKSEIVAWRCKTNCKIGRDAINSSTDPGRIIYAMFCLLHAIEELSNQISELKKK